MNVRKIYLFTLFYPHIKGEPFLSPELAVANALREFEIILVPFYRVVVQRNLPDKIKVDTSLADKLYENRETKVYPLLFNLYAIFKGFVRHRVKSISGMRDVAGFVHHGNIIKEWASENIKDSGSILYTYWFERVTYGLALFKENSNRNHHLLITRAHNFDLYEERRKHNFIPFRKETLGQTDYLFSISKSGLDLLNVLYPWYKKIKVSKLGVKDHYKKTEKDQTLRIVSCSYIVPLKRVELIASVLIELALVHSEKKIEWHHFGDGPNDSMVVNVLKECPVNLHYTLHGHVENKYVIQFYSRHYVDVFINLSEYEGIPVSIMEAISFGIPVVACGVGGVPEIVVGEVGYLLEKDFKKEDAIKSIQHLVGKEHYRKATRHQYLSTYTADKNYMEFYHDLSTLR